MLNPNEDRQDYGSILSAPPNYELDFAIGTSYSLDLDSLIGASISLGLNEETDTVLKDNPIFLLEALRATGDKVALFCQKGSIHLPNNPTKLHILLEEMVFQVNVEENEKTVTLEERFAHLEQIVARMEDADVSLDEAFELYKKGLDEVKSANDMVQGMEKAMLVLNSNGQLEEF